MNPTTPPPKTTRIVTPRHISEYRTSAYYRDFGFPDDKLRQDDMRHGYLLALEEVMRG